MAITNDYEPDDMTLDQEPPPAGLPFEAHELWRIASSAIRHQGTLGQCGLHIRAMLRLEAKCNQLLMQNNRLKDVVR